MHKFKWFRSLWLFFFFSAFSSGQTAAVSGSRKPLFYKLKATVSQSVIFVRLRDKKTLFKKSANSLQIPASVTKLVTSGASLYHFGPQYKFLTNFYHTGARTGHLIKGDLVIVGSGDPLFISEKLWQAAADLRHMGIRSITGNIIIDNSLFDNETRDSSRLAGKNLSIHAYDAPLSAFGINFNTFVIAMAPGERIGSKGIVELDPYPLRGLMVENRLRTGKPNYGTSSQVSRISKKGGDTRMIVTGAISQSGPLKKVYRSVGDPVKAAGEQVRAFLNKEGIVIQGAVRPGIRPKRATHLLTVEGYPLKKIIESLNKYSNNYVADVLVKKLALKSGARQGSLKAGLEIIQRFLKNRVGVPGSFVIKNGSGLAVENRLSAEQLVKLLIFMAERFDLFPEYLNSLPSAGVDGTLKDRFQSRGTQNYKGVVRAKTGTLTSPVSVASLVGYLRHKNHGLVAFAILENGVKGRTQPGLTDLRDRQDKALVRFLEHY